jgi:hypothetical protein
MRRFFHNRKYAKYTVRGFILGVLVTVLISCLFEICGANSEKTMPVVASEPTTEETVAKVEPEEIEKPVIDEKELEMLAHLIGGEAGADWCKDEMLYYVGSVVLNRVNSPYFPDTIEGVIFQKGQYACTWDGNYNRTPSERCYRIAEELLKYGSVLPDNVVFQAEFKQGSGVYEKVQNMYFCYK